MSELNTLQDSLIFAYEVIMTQMEEGVRIKGMTGDLFMAIGFLFVVVLCLVLIGFVDDIKKVIRDELKKEMKDK